MTEWNGSEELNRLRLRPHVSDIFESAPFSFWIQKFPRPHVSVFKSNSPVRQVFGYTLVPRIPLEKLATEHASYSSLRGTWERGCHLAYSIHGKELGPVVRRPISVNPGLNFNPGFFFFCSKTISRIIFSSLFIESNHQIVDTKRIKLNLLFKLSYLNQNFALTLGQPSFEQLPGPGLDPNCYVTG